MLEQLAAKIAQFKQQPEQTAFSDVINTIDTHYSFTPVKFQNGAQINEEGQNNGSCKILFFAQLNQFDEATTLNLFGDYYRVDVLENPEGDDHQNIRQFIKHGWEGVAFSTTALVSNSQ
ncbi:HopJ type III effector protein [Marinomonas mediterranea]|jgi:HopJ type III effector protein.|uniref:HopJ type III effector protein n=1 Tax=Marinomonas mediterranea (strain ATCC 700492 / JCM 21426 / NBRC 103028 / MMB-1) TaxID=717774 RepID=F2JVT1_MARM1|nr:HopJ type III effector protein [Marinomonas mediterranea]ADZ91717.1 HopJ type III effector protein [Marinomonas mediterranea MMB-1]WCN17813.1 type III effector [Marinomonas mediterranea MMB-1]